MSESVGVASVWLARLVRLARLKLTQELARLEDVSQIYSVHYECITYKQGMLNNFELFLLCCVSSP